jgi:uncharacterized lipoprotein YajG
MITMLRRLSGPWLALALAGCVAGQSLQTTYTPPAPAQAAAPAADARVSVLIQVADDRAYVKNGDKPPHYIGKYRAGFGNPWNVYTENDEPLASVLARDLSVDLAALGYDVRTAAPVDRRLAVSIKEWNFDGYQNGKMWYELEASVHDGTGNVVASDTVRDETVIKGTFWMGARGGFEREMPKLYAAAVTRLVRDNSRISAALSAKAN